MRNILVTGGAGFIGSNFVYYLTEKDPSLRVVILDALTYAGRRESLDGLPPDAGVVFVQGDICDRALVDELLAVHEIDSIVHFAAESHVDRGIRGPEPFIRTNVHGTFTLLEAARGRAAAVGTAPRFHHVSTDEVFGALGPGDPPFSEATAYAPRSPYSASKAASDHLVRAYGITYGIPVTISNCSNNYGPYQFPEKLIPLMIVNALSGKPLPIYGDGAQIRDWLHVKDHCDAIYRILRSGRRGETYCVGGDNQPTNLSIVRLICALLDRKAPRADGKSYAEQIQFVSDRPGHDFRYDIDSGKIKRDLGWRQSYRFEDGIAATVDWYLANGAWLSLITGDSSYANWIDRNYLGRGETKSGGAAKGASE